MQYCFKALLLLHIAEGKSPSFPYAHWKRVHIYQRVHTIAVWPIYSNRGKKNGWEQRRQRGQEGGGALCTTLLQLHFHWWPCGCKSESRRPFLTSCFFFSSSFYSPAVHTSPTSNECQYLIWTHFNLLASRSQIFICLTSEFRRLNLQCLVADVLNFVCSVESAWYGIAYITTNITVCMNRQLIYAILLIYIQLSR